MVVLFLNKLMPIEGGIYQWTRVGLGETVGFMTAWNLWLFNLTSLATAGTQVSEYVRVGIGGSNWISDSRSIWMGLLVMLAVGMITIRGLRFGRWVHNVGSAVTLLGYGLVLTMPFVLRLFQKHTGPYLPSMRWPEMTPVNISLITKLAFLPLCGFEQIVIVAGESKSPQKSIKRAILWAAPLVPLLLVLSTSATLSLVKPAELSLITPMLNVLDKGFQEFNVSRFVIPFIAGTLLFNIFANQSLSLTENSCLPMVAGWNHLLPPIFARLHTRYHTPVVAIMVDLGIATTIMIFNSLGIGRDEVFQSDFQSVRGLLRSDILSYVCRSAIRRA